MNFRFTEDEEKWREEVRDWIKGQGITRELEQYPLEDLTDEQRAKARELQRKLIEKGWYGIGVPKKHGGGGMPPIKAAIFNEEWAYHRLPELYGMQLTMVLPAVLQYGSEELLRFHLQHEILKEGKVYWQAFTEAEAGSDAANIQLRAVRDGDDYILNGVKIFIGAKYEVDYLYTLALTGPYADRHGNLTAFLIDAHSPGITYTPLQPWAGFVKNQVYYEDVSVPTSNIIGEVNKGWLVQTASLEVEHGGLVGAGGSDARFDRLLQFCKEAKRNGKLLIEDAHVQEVLADLYMTVRLGKLYELRVLWLGSKGLRVTYEGSQNSLFWKYIKEKFAYAISEIMGPYAFLKEGTKWTEGMDHLEAAEKAGVETHAGGTPEMQMLIMGRALGFPRR